MTRTPWHVRIARKHGQSAVLYAALALSAPGEYSLAVMAGWSRDVAWLMPAVMSLYAAIGASIAKSQKEAAREAVGTADAKAAKRRSSNATWGALIALLGATAAQITEHVITTGVRGGLAWVVIVVSAVPPMVAAHVLHIDPPQDEAVIVAALDELQTRRVVEPAEPATESAAEPPAAWKVDVNKQVPARVPPLRKPVKVSAPGEKLTLKAAADRLGVHPTTLYRRRDAGTLKVEQGPRGQLVLWSDVQPVNALP